jgi:hypothetical protein
MITAMMELMNSAVICYEDLSQQKNIIQVVYGDRVDRVRTQEIRDSIRKDDVDQILNMLTGVDDSDISVAINDIWAPLVAELVTEFARVGSTFDREDRIGQFMRRQIRSALIVDVQAAVICWFVPVSRAYLSAAHLAALVFSRCGIASGIWPWSSIPPGPSLYVGESAQNSGNTARCLGEIRYQF